MAEPVPLPKYHQVYLVLREQLAEGRFQRGLPGELHLMKEFGVARVTVRRALERLASEGLIHRAPGRGTVAVEPALPLAARAAGQRAHLTGLLENIVNMGLRTQAKVIDCDVIPAPAAVARELALPAGSPVQKAVRLRSSGAGPLAFITTYVPQALATGFGRRELAKKPLLLLLEGAGVKIGRARQVISARLADVGVARHLEVEVGSALLAVNRLVYDMQERPVQWLQGLYRPDRYQYEMQLSRLGGIDAKIWVSTEVAAQFH
jgi:GntR family transcriptional regulator